MNMKENIILNTDSYKVSHWLQYPEGSQKVYSYIESRGGRFQETTFFGLQMFLKEYMTKPVTVEMVEQAEVFFKAHGEPFNKEGWMRLIEKYDGYMPLTIQAIPEGLTVPVGNALVSVVNNDPEFFWLTSYVETALLRAIWYPVTVATQSREIKKMILSYLEKTGTPEDISFKLHDFGARGVSSNESAGIGGAAHLINFLGTDTVMGAVYAMEYYNTDEMPAFSIPASEHSTMTAWGGREGEIDAMRNMLKQFAKPGSLVACVSDSYDIYAAARDLWGDKLKQEIIDSGATLVVRPDSGVPWEVVLDVTRILGKQFGYTVNEKGYKVLPPSIRVIQGDGVNYDSIERILYELTEAGWSADNVAFGMGGALLQQVNRDTQKFAMKASAIMIDNKWIDVFKDPVTDNVKKSKKGLLKLFKIDGEYKTIDILRDRDWTDRRVDLMQTVFENGVIKKEYTFEKVRENAKL